MILVSATFFDKLIAALWAAAKFLVLTVINLNFYLPDLLVRNINTSVFFLKTLFCVRKSDFSHFRRKIPIALLTTFSILPLATQSLLLPTWKIFSAFRNKGRQKGG